MTIRDDRPRILVADDQRDVREALRLLLKTEGYETETAASPAEVLEAVGSRDFDVVLMDLNYTRDTTSGREGLDLLARLRGADESLPVVVMTAWASVGLAVEVMRRGARDFLENFYGITSSPLHFGLPTDRLAVRWELDSPRVQALAAGGDLSTTVVTPDVPRVNEVKWQAGWPVSSEPDLSLEDPEVLLEIPPEWDVLSRSGPRVAQDWHGKVRRALSHYLSRGYVAADFAPTEERGRRRPLYFLRRR